MPRSHPPYPPEFRAEARMAVFDFIEGFYNPRRRHSALAYLSPAEYERRHLPQLSCPSDHPSTRAG
jgi:transposase InsO family protein